MQIFNPAFRNGEHTPLSASCVTKFFYYKLKYKNVEKCLWRRMFSARSR